MSIDIKKSDVAWNVAASVMRLASGFIMLPIIINRLSAEDVGLWTTVFIALNSSIILLDFGFFTTFSRNITYIFSGAKELQRYRDWERWIQMGKSLILCLKEL